VQLTRNALAALVGQPQLQVEPRALADARPVPLPDTLPADLLARRPDITAARWRVEAATHDVASAKASFYPNVNLSAFVGLSSIGLGRLLDAGSEQWGVGPAIHLPIFDAGRLRANLRGKSADLDLAVESYNGAVLDAVRDVADQLASARSITRQQAQQREAQAAAESAYDIAAAAVPRRPGHLPERADRRDGGAQPAPAGRRPRRPRPGHASATDARARRRLPARCRHAAPRHPDEPE
jgi:NodT family efflux transporter outer membrane factor (OMF) lipoprotein